MSKTATLPLIVCSNDYLASVVNRAVGVLLDAASGAATAQRDAMALWPPGMLDNRAQRVALLDQLNDVKVLINPELPSKTRGLFDDGLAANRL